MRTWSAVARCLSRVVARLSLTAVLGEVGQQFVHPVEIGPVDQVSATAHLGHHARVHQLLEMEGERRRRDLKFVRNQAGRQTGLAGNDQRTKDPQSVRLREGGKGLQYGLLFHCSITMEIISSLHDSRQYRKIDLY